MNGMLSKVGAQSVVDRTAAELRAAVNRAAEGDFLGNELDLARRLGVSAPTFRQAARILEHEHLLLIKRGVSGGYFARKPGLDAAVHLAAMALRSEKSNRRQAYEVAWPNFDLGLRLAAQSSDEALRGELKSKYVDGDGAHAADVYTEAAFLNLIIRMTDNVALTLILRILLNDFGHAVTPHVFFIPPRSVALRRSVALAVLARDGAEAVRLAEKRRRYFLALTEAQEASLSRRNGRRPKKRNAA